MNWHYYRNQFAQRGKNGLRGGHLFCPPRITGGRPARPATEAPAAGKGFTAAGHLTGPPQEIVIYRGGRYESPAAVNTIYRGGLFKLPAAVKAQAQNPQQGPI